jgi:hypothetical protein
MCPHPDHASLVIAMIIPASTKRTIAICIQIQVGDIERTAYFLRSHDRAELARDQTIRRWGRQTGSSAASRLNEPKMRRDDC